MSDKIDQVSGSLMQRPAILSKALLFTKHGIDGCHVGHAGKGWSKLSKKQAGQRYTTPMTALLKVNLHLEV